MVELEIRAAVGANIGLQKCFLIELMERILSRHFPFEVSGSPFYGVREDASVYRLLKLGKWVRLCAALESAM